MREFLRNIHAYYLMWFNRERFNEKAKVIHKKIEEERKKKSDEKMNREREKAENSKPDDSSDDILDAKTQEYRDLHLVSFFVVFFWVAIGAIAGAWIECYFVPPDYFVKLIRVSALLLAGITVLAVLPFHKIPIWGETYQEKVSRAIVRYLYILSLALISMSLFMM